ncbi:MAG: NAD(P)-dependent oxidoreductase [Pseudomonadota bacterium]
MDKRAGVVGIGNMGSGLAKNLIANGFTVTGIDLKADRMAAFKAMGGVAAESPAEVSANADAVFVMVMTGDEAKEVIFAEDGLLSTMTQGSAIILTATIKPHEAVEIAARMEGSGVRLIDSPVSGGYPGAQAGTLTLMAAAPAEWLTEFAPFMEAVSATIHHVGTQAGQGQTMKAVLQSIIGSMFSATFEATVLAAKAGLTGQAVLDVVQSSSAGNTITKTSLENIIDRKFHDTGSHIDTMHKDLTISMDLGEQLLVPLHTASAAMQIFHAGKAAHPTGDNWASTLVLEKICGAKLER